MTARLVEVKRNGRVESVHSGSIAVVDVDGRLVASSGDPDLFAYFRSSAKPFQAIPLIESGAADYFGLTAAELALCCASHHGSARHQHAVEEFLSKLELPVDAMRCGSPLPIDDVAAGRILSGLDHASPLQCDCSGKHAGMLATCLRCGFPVETYREPSHPLQLEIRTVMGEVCRLSADQLFLATDGCSVPTFGASIRSFAQAYATLGSPNQAPRGFGWEHAAALNRLRQAMIAHPENVAGEGSIVTDLMALSGGKIVAKGGAEGLLCLAVPDRNIGIALRVADGSFRAHPPVVLELLKSLDLLDACLIAQIEAHHPAVVRNHNGWEVGGIVPVFELRRD
jgi:L-asparaginase II